MRQASQNAPLFIEAFYDACENLRGGKESYDAPDAQLINEVCLEHRVGYEIQPPDLVLRAESTPLVSVPARPPTLNEEAKVLYQQSIQRSEQLLSEGHSREAVGETIWLLESVATAFKGLEANGDVVQGKYFNKIVRELRELFQDTTLDRVLAWTEQLHGYLSSPGGGGIRHGLDIQQSKPITHNEARLFCNLVRSYLSYLLAEHERLTGHEKK